MVFVITFLHWGWKAGPHEHQTSSLPLISPALLHILFWDRVRLSCPSSLSIFSVAQVGLEAASLIFPNSWGYRFQQPGLICCMLYVYVICTGSLPPPPTAVHLPPPKQPTFHFVVISWCFPPMRKKNCAFSFLSLISFSLLASGSIHFPINDIILFIIVE